MISGHTTTLTVPEGKVGFLEGRSYPSGTVLTVPDRITGWDQLYDYGDEENTTEATLEVPAGREDFRGWKVVSGSGSDTITTYYFVNERSKAYVVSTEDEVAVPVYENKDLPAVLTFSDGTEFPGTYYYGGVVDLPAPQVEANFVGWYSKGFVFPAGYTYMITDEVTEFTAMHTGTGDCRQLEAPDGYLYVLHGNVYTAAEARALYVPSDPSSH